MKTVHIVFPEKIGHIDPEIYGHFAEHIGGVIYDGLWVGRNSPIPNIKGFRKDIVEKLKKINPPVLRWPGGCFAETYHWRDGIGNNRPTRPNWWTYKDGRYETNEVGTHEIIDLCELIGAKPYFAVNVTSISPMEARDWMDYCLSPRGSTTLAQEREANGHPEPFDIPFWGIGNENWGGGGNMTPDYYALQYRKFATVLKNICQDKAKLIAGGADADSYYWTQDLIKNLSSGRAPMDGMSFHYYCGKAGGAVDFSTDEWYELIAKAEKMETLIERHSAVTVGYGIQERAKLVIDEWGCWHPENSGPSKGYNLFEQQSTMRDAVIAALTLNIFNNHSDKILMANVAQLCNNLHCLFLAGGENCIATPTYYVYDMYKTHQDAQALRTLVEDNGGPDSKISVSASVKGNCITLTMANLSAEQDIDVNISMLGITDFSRTAEMTVLSASDIHAHNTFDDPENVAPRTENINISEPIKIPYASVASLKLDI